MLKRITQAFHCAFFPLNSALSVWLTGSVSVAASPEERSVMLVVKPSKELLKTRIGFNLLDRIEHVPKLVMTPGLVDEILARMARGHDLRAALATRDDMMASRWHRAPTEYAF